MLIANHNLDEKVLIVAEIGNNHEGDFALACEQVQIAAETGVDAVKFQSINPLQLVSPAESKRVAQLQSFYFTYDQYAYLAELAAKQGLIFLTTLFDVDAVAQFDSILPAYKVASGDNDFIPMIEAMARTGKPILLSTGMSSLQTLDHTQAAIKRIWSDNGVDPGLVMLHCVSSYPTKPSDANLLAMTSLSTFDVTLGYSDHTQGVDAVFLSIALGARVIEKHFTHDKQHSSFRDHQLSANPAEMAAIVKGVRLAEQMLGQGEKTVQDSEQATMLAARRSICATRDIAAGEVLSMADFRWLRPAGGLSPGSEDQLIGKTLQVAVAVGTAIQPDMVQ